MLKKFVISTLLLVAVFVASTPLAHAASKSATLLVTAVVLDSCQASATGSVSTADAVKVRCNSATPYRISTAARTVGASVPANGASVTPQGQITSRALSGDSQPANAGAGSSQAVLVTITY